MISKIVCSSVLLAVTHSVFAGPFGLEMGAPLSSLKEGFTAEEKSKHVYQLSSVPKPHTRFATYIAIVTPAQGLCKVVAISEPIKTSAYGDGLKSQFDAIDDALVKKYGDRKRYDYLRHGSLWKEPQYWMMGLLKKERRLLAFWPPTDKDALADELSTVSLEAAALTTEAGSLTLSYEFQNFSDCSAAIKSTENSAL